MKYIILPVFSPIFRFIGALIISLIRVIFYIIAACVDLWEWKLTYLTEMWKSPFFDTEPSIIVSYRPNPYKVYKTFGDFVMNKYTIEHTEPSTDASLRRRHSNY